MGALAVPLQIASVAFTAFSSFQAAGAAEEQGKAQQAIYNMQAQNARTVAERNALIATDEANYSAANQRVQAGQEQSSSQRAAQEHRRQTTLAASSARAKAAASGGGALDPTVLDEIGNIEGFGEFTALTDLYEGNSTAGLLRDQAGLTEYQGKRNAEIIKYGGASDANLLNYQGQVASFDAKQKAQSARTSAIGTIFEGGTNIATKYAPKNYIDWNQGGRTYY